MMRSTSSEDKKMTTKTLLAFVALTFALSWGIVLVYITVPQVESAFGPLGYSNPLYFLAVWAPTFSALTLVARHLGLRGLGAFLRRLTMWRMPAVWWAFLIVGLPAIFYIGAGIKGTFPAPIPFSTWNAAGVALLTAFTLGPVEELGWRGFALPLLQRRFSQFTASLVVGFVWAVWHLPAFLLSGTPLSNWSFGTFFLGVMAIALVLTPMINAARGSLLVAYLFHFTLMNPIFPDAQPWDSVILSVVAVVVVAANRKTMFTRGAGVTAVVAPSHPVGAKGKLCEPRMSEEPAPILP